MPFIGYDFETMRDKIYTDGQACWVRCRWCEEQDVLCVVESTQSHMCFHCWVEANVLCGEMIVNRAEGGEPEDGWIQDEWNGSMYFSNVPDFDYNADDEEGVIMRTKRREV